jgi:hypothetical protein
MLLAIGLLMIFVFLLAGISSRERRIKGGLERKQWFDYIDLHELFNLFKHTEKDREDP